MESTERGKSEGNSKSNPEPRKVVLGGSTGSGSRDGRSEQFTPPVPNSELMGSPALGIALIASQLIGADVIKGNQLSDYFNKEGGTLMNSVKDDKLSRAIIIAKRLVELAK
jgi:hypothetical protein